MHLENLKTDTTERPVMTLKDLFTHGTYEGHGVGIVGHLSEDDLPHMLDFHPRKIFRKRKKKKLHFIQQLS